MARQVLVIGAGRFGTSVASNLYQLGNDVMVVDSDDSRIKKISEEVTDAVEGDATTESCLAALNVNNFDVVVVAIGENLQASIMITIMLEELKAKFIVAKARSDLHGKVLEKLGVDHVIFPERDMGKRLARNITAPSMLDFIELSDQYSLVEVAAPEEYVGKTLKELDLRAKYGVNIIALLKANKNDSNISPMADDLIEEGDVLVAIGSNEAHKKLKWI